MLKKSERYAKLNAMGINTSKYFTVDLDNGTKIHLIIDENGNCTQVKDDPIASSIISDGYVRNSKLHRRFIMAQMFYALNYKSYDGQYEGYNDCLKNCYGYDYTLKMMLEEVRVLSKLEVRDKETFEERAHFFTKEVVAAVMEDYLEKLEAYIDSLHTYKCKGVPYKKVKGINIFVEDLNRKVYMPIKHNISRVKYTRNYAEVYKILSEFMNKRTFIKLPYETPKSKVWIDAFKGEGAYYTLLNLTRFHGCKIIVRPAYDLGVGNSVETYLKAALDAYKGEGWRMFALMKKVIADNNFNFKDAMAKVYSEK